MSNFSHITEQSPALLAKWGIWKLISSFYRSLQFHRYQTECKRKIVTSQSHLLFFSSRCHDIEQGQIHFLRRKITINSVAYFLQRKASFHLNDVWKFIFVWLYDIDFKNKKIFENNFLQGDFFLFVLSPFFDLKDMENYKLRTLWRR